MPATLFRLLAAIGVLFSFAATTFADEALPIIDAHNQSDQHISYDEILALMDQAKVARVILTQRGKVWPEALAKFASRHPDRITAAAGRRAGTIGKTGSTNTTGSSRSRPACPSSGRWAK